MINKEDPKIRDKIHDLADKDKPQTPESFPLDLSLDYSRKEAYKTLQGEEDVFSFNGSSVSVVWNESNIKGKGLGDEIDSYDYVFRIGSKTSSGKRSDIGRRTDFQFLEKEDFILQNTFEDVRIIMSSYDRGSVPNVFYKVLEDSTIYLLKEDFRRFLDNFKDVHMLDDVPDYLFLILLSLRLFDVVHFYGLDPYAVDEEDLTFSFHFKGLITLKDIYE